MRELFPINKIFLIHFIDSPLDIKGAIAAVSQFLIIVSSSKYRKSLLSTNDSFKFNKVTPTFDVFKAPISLFHHHTLKDFFQIILNLILFVFYSFLTYDKIILCMVLLNIYLELLM